ncbi:MAG TPA: GYF domain-containing protein, partial [Polyangiaceae bacterium]|nr:GYF domain-containing protein [Polyangiaceae bacterium]
MTASFADQEIWHVLLARDDLKRMNVDQLDDAFRLDIVDASTLVWKQGMDTWRSLGSIAGIDDEPETVIRAPARPRTPPPPPRPQPRSLAPAVNPFAATVNPFAATANPFAATAQYTSSMPAAVFPAPLVAPVASQQFFAPDPYALP